MINPSESSKQLREMITHAIDDHKITQEEYDMIIHIATKDSHIDQHEKILLEQLHEMIENKMVKLVRK